MTGSGYILIERFYEKQRNKYKNTGVTSTVMFSKYFTN